MSQTYIDAPGHGLSAGDAITFSNLEGGQGIIQGSLYYVIASGLTSDIFQFSETDGGSAFAFDTPITSGNVSTWPTYSVVSGIMSPPDAPAAPTGLTLTTFITADADGHQHSVVAADLVHDTTDGVSGAVVEATWTDAGGSTPDWTKKAVVNLPLGTLRASFVVPGNLTVWVRAYAVTVYGATSSYTSVGSTTSAKDSTAPATPSGLTGIGGVLGIAAKWDANSELDLAYYEFQWDDDSGFGSAETKQFKGNLAVIPGLTDGTWYVRVRAVDTSGNASAYTSGQSAVARLVDTSDIDPDAVVNQATNLINGTATITIDDDGLHVEDGALFLKDEFGETVLVASGFSGSWATFIGLGLYNGDFDAGTLGTLPNGRTAALPYWTISDVTGTPTATLQEVSDERSIKVTFSAHTTKKKFVSDLVPVSLGQELFYGVRVYGNRAAGEVVVTVGIEFTDDGVFFTGGIEDSITYDAVNTSGPYDAYTANTALGHYARVYITVEETTAHSSSNYATLYTSWLKQNNNEGIILQLQTRLDMKGTGLSQARVLNINYDNKLTFGWTSDYSDGDVALWRAGGNTLQLDDGDGGAASLHAVGDVAADGLVKIGGSDDLYLRREGAGALQVDSNGGSSQSRIGVESTSGQRAVVVANVAGDSAARMVLGGDATRAGLELGSGGGSRDVYAYRSGTKTLKVDADGAGANLDAIELDADDVYSSKGASTSFSIVNGGSATYSNKDAKWVRIGDWVFWEVVFTVTGAGSGSSAVSITFTGAPPPNAGALYQPGARSGSTADWRARIAASGSNLFIALYIGTTAAKGSDLATATYAFSGSYRAA